MVIRADDGTISPISVSLYNRGDNGNLPVSTFNTRIEEWKQGLDDHLKVESTERNSKGAVAVEGWMWRKGDTAALLESSINRSEKRPEFIRLRSASISAAKNQSTGVAKRRSLADNVVNDDKGNVMIDGVPMVDQGERGIVWWHRSSASDATTGLRWTSMRWHSLPTPPRTARTPT